LFSESTALGERAQLSMALDQEGTGRHSRQGDLTKVLVAPRPPKERHGLPETVDCPTIVSLGLVGCAKVAVRQRLQGDLPVSRGDRKGALGGSDALVMRAH